MKKEPMLHYGVPGMKWGVRKKRDRGRPASSLSDTELRQAVNRMNMEKNYNRLVSENSSGLSKVGGELQGIMRTAAKGALIGAATVRFTRAINFALSRTIG